jgi:hypothetical protein
VAVGSGIEVSVGRGVSVATTSGAASTAFTTSGEGVGVSVTVCATASLVACSGLVRTVRVVGLGKADEISAVWPELQAVKTTIRSSVILRVMEKNFIHLLNSLVFLE